MPSQFREGVYDLVIIVINNYIRLKLSNWGAASGMGEDPAWRRCTKTIEEVECTLAAAVYTVSVVLPVDREFLEGERAPFQFDRSNFISFKAQKVINVAHLLPSLIAALLATAPPLPPPIQIPPHPSPALCCLAVPVAYT